jgi:hypothetical protein
MDAILAYSLQQHSSVQTCTKVPIYNKIVVNVSRSQDPPPPDPDRTITDLERGDDEPKETELSFLESIFSFIFGDGNPNGDFEIRRMCAITGSKVYFPFLCNVLRSNQS